MFTPLFTGTLVRLRGSHFSERGASLFYLRCRFNGTVVPAVFISTSAVGCAAPEMPPGPAPVELTNNNNDYTSDGLAFAYEVVRLTGVSPVEGPAAGGTHVTLAGTSFGGKTDEYFCRFGAMEVVALVLSREQV